MPAWRETVLEKAPMNANERKILSITCFGHFMSHFNMLIFPALVLPLMQRYGMDLAAVLALSFWMYLLFGITALPWGLLSDRIGALSPCF
jgi:MFS family permease